MKVDGNLHITKDVVLGKNTDDNGFILHSRNGLDQNGDFFSLEYRWDNSTSTWKYQNGISLLGNNYLCPDNSFINPGNVGIGTNRPKDNFHVNGNIRAGSCGSKIYFRDNYFNIEGTTPLLTEGTSLAFEGFISGNAQDDDYSKTNNSSFNVNKDLLYGLHLNTLAFSWGQDPLFYHAGTHRFFTMQETGEPGSGTFVETEKMRITRDGRVGIGTSAPDGESKLDVAGAVRAEKFIIGDWVLEEEPPDYVFSPEYKVTPLLELECYIKENSHLPEIPSATEMKENGLDLIKFNMTLLKKVEEITLHLIEQKKEIESLKKVNNELKAKLEMRDE